jgi:hypothetical protein
MVANVKKLYICFAILIDIISIRFSLDLET